MEKRTNFSRKHLVQLLILILIGWGVGQLLQRGVPMGRDLSSNTTVQALLIDHSSPSREVDVPTLTLVVFSDYQCPACKLSNSAMDAAVQKDGHVRIVYMDWPIFGVISEEAARVAIAADRQGIYPKVHARLMNDRRPLNEHVLQQIVLASGGSWKQIHSDLVNHAADIENQINLNRSHAIKLGIAGTPTYLVGSLLMSGALNEAEFTEAFALGRKAAAGQ